METADLQPVWNDASYVQRLSQHERMRRLLALHGIDYDPNLTRTRTPDSKGVWSRPYDKLMLKVLVSDMRVLRIEPIRSLGDTGSPQSHAFLQRIGRYAVRVVYATGLDQAEVIIRCDSRRQATVLRIRATAHSVRPEQQAEDASFLLGMDPEFVIVNAQGKLVPASRFLDFDGSVGYDTATIKGRPDLHPLAELRPAPSAEPDELVRNLRKTMWQAAARITDPSLRWVAGGMPVRGMPLGGHIHFSGVPLRASLVRALDNYMAMPLLLLEHPSGIDRRRKYGQLGDIRLKAYGGFEYRTLPSLLNSPTLTKGALAMAKLIALHSSRLTKRYLDQERYASAYYQGDKQALLEPVERVWQELVRLPGYGDYAAELSRVKQWIDNRRVWEETVDFRVYWRIPPYH